MAKKTFICDRCACEYTPVFAPKKNTSGKHFCSRNCANLDKLKGQPEKGDKPERRCERCGEVLTKPTQKKYCSSGCSKAEQDDNQGYTYTDSRGREKPVGVCLGCGERPKYEDRTGANKVNFCSDKCAAAWNRLRYEYTDYPEPEE